MFCLVYCVVWYSVGVLYFVARVVCLFVLCLFVLSVCIDCWSACVFFFPQCVLCCIAMVFSIVFVFSLVFLGFGVLLKCVWLFVLRCI